MKRLLENKNHCCGLGMELGGRAFVWRACLVLSTTTTATRATTKLSKPTFFGFIASKAFCQCRTSLSSPALVGGDLSPFHIQISLKHQVFQRVPGANWTCDLMCRLRKRGYIIIAYGIAPGQLILLHILGRISSFSLLVFFSDEYWTQGPYIRGKLSTTDLHSQPSCFWFNVNS